MKTLREDVAEWMQSETARMYQTAQYAQWRCSAKFANDSVSAYYCSVAIDSQESAARQWRKTFDYLYGVQP